MKRTILCLAAIACLISPTMALAGGGCSTRPVRVVHRQPSPVHHPPRVPVYITQPAPKRTYTPIRTTSQPARSVVQSRSRQAPQSPVMSTEQRLDAAKQAFRCGHNNVALAHAGMLLEQLPNNANLLQFRSLIYFRKGDYKRSALDAYEAVKYGPIWNTSTIRDLYAYPAFYDRELRLLRLDENTDLSIAFLSAYHHLAAGELGSGHDALQRVLAIKPGDQIATALINLIDTRQGKNKNDKLADTNH